VPPGVDLELFRPERGSWEELRRLLASAGGTAHAERLPDPDAAARLAGVDRFVLYFGKLLFTKGVDTLLEAWGAIAADHPGHHLVVVGFGGDRAALEAQAGRRVVFTGAMDHEQLSRLVPLADCTVVPSVLPEAFGMVAAEAAACGVIPVVAGHSGLAEVAEGLGEAARSFPPGDAEALAGRLEEVLDLPDPQRRRLGELGRKRVAERWSWRHVAERLITESALQR
jgi:glycosyltransferase involved in cell wall biosynthesis